MKNVLCAILFIFLFLPPLKAQNEFDEFSEFETGDEFEQFNEYPTTPTVTPVSYSSACGEECDYDLPTTPLAQNWWDVPTELTGLEYDRDSLPDSSVYVPPYELAGKDSEGAGSPAGDTVASDDGTTDDIKKAGATDYMDLQKSCEACENDALLAGLEAPQAAPVPTTSCEMTDSEGNCVFGSNGGGTSQ